MILEFFKIQKMAFDRAGEFLFVAAKKYGLHRQVASGICLTKVRDIIGAKFPHFVEFWEPKKFEHGKLTIATSNAAASSELFMRTHELLEIFEGEDFPQKIKEIAIVKK